MRRFAAHAVLLGLSTSVFAQSPTIDVWDGTTQSFGSLGSPQRWVNVQGNVSNKAQVTSLTYTLNGGAPVNLNMGNNQRRLVGEGDFNVDLDRAQLLQGANTLLITAQTAGGPVTQTITLNYDATTVWPGNYAIDWSTVTKTSDVIQMVDGHWSHTAAGVRPAVPSYDRTFVVGDITWDNFEVVVPITVHGLDPSPAKYSTISVSPGFGFTGRWTGHTQFKAGEQPLQFWLPQGGGPWFDFGKPNGSPRFYLAGSDGLFIDDPQNRTTMPFGQKVWWKLRVETLPSGDTWYGLKRWDDGAAEPTMFDIFGTEGTNDLQAGSVIFVAHHVDMTVGNLQITALTSDTTAPVLDTPQVTRASNSAVVRWNSDEPADSAVSYGRTNSYELGTVRLSALVAAHQVSLMGLSADTTYHFRVTSEDGRGNATSSGDLTFTTTGSGGGGGTQIPRSNLSTDEFDGSALDTTKWLMIDPLADASLSVGGGQVSITAPSSATHDVWTQSNDLPRIMRQAPNTDFDVEVKFDSPLATVAGEFRSQGILLEESPSHVLRLEFHSVNGTTKVFAARLLNGKAKIYKNLTVSAIGSTTAPMWLRLIRTGNVFKLQYSVDGTNWTQAVQFSNAMAPAAIGIYAGNGAGHSHTAVVDVFKVNAGGGNPDTDPPVISGVTATPTTDGATIAWTTDEPATSVVEFGTTSSYGTTVDNGATLGTSHSLVLSGLTTNMVYHYRVTSVDAAGNPAVGADRTFTTVGDTTPPVLSDIAAAPQAGGATVTWTTDEAATSVLEYGLTTSYGSTANNGAVLSTSHTLAVAGLSPLTTYHYRVRSVDAAGNAAVSADRTFITLSSSGGGLSSDEFNTVDLNKWSFVDPLGDATVAAVNGAAQISIPASTTIHDAWTSSNHCPRLTQDFTGDDFDVEAVFASDLTGSAFKSHGVMIEQDPLNIIRIEFHVSGGRTNAFVATIFNGSAKTRKFRSISHATPSSLRVIRAGNRFTIQMSFSGGAASTLVSFDQAMTVNKIGLFAGCADDAHQAAFDRFIVHSGGGGDTTPPVISGIQVSGDTVSWTTDEGATSEVRYGLTNSLELPPVTNGALVTSHSVALPSLQPNTRYYYRVVSRDAAGNTSVSGVDEFTTPGDSTPPVISDVNVDGDTVTWNTDEAATSQVKYGLTSNLELAPVSSSSLVTSHSLQLPNLQPSTTYYFAVVSADAAGNPAQTAVDTFTTAGDTTPPVISNINVNQAGDTVTWDTNEAATSEVKYGLTQQLELTPVSSSSLVTSHSLQFPNLQPSTTYYYSVVSSDAASNTAQSATLSFTTPGDTTPPVITGVTALGDTVTWITDEPASSEVHYGLTQQLELPSVTSSALVTGHSLVLPGLSPSTTYYFQVASEDASGNRGTSAILSFTTPQGGLVSDEFSAATIDFNTWTFLDNQADCTLSAANGKAEISIPNSTVIHDVWTTSNDLGRLMQSAPSGDWTAEVKFDSVLTGANFKSQGILVEVDPLNVIRSEFLVSGGKVYVFVASIIGGSATVRKFVNVVAPGSTYLRVGRTGSTWKVEYSTDGSNWSTASTFNLGINPTKVGFYAGSGANTPHTVQADYFRAL